MHLRVFSWVRIGSTAAVLCVALTPAKAQGLSPNTQAAEYVRLGTQLLAVEHSVSIQSTVDIDAPLSQATVTGLQSFTGWAIDAVSPIGRVEIAIDGVAYGQATYGVTRQDVCNANPGRPGCPYVGYTLSLYTAMLSNGAHTLSVTAWASEKVPRPTTIRRRFSTQNSNVSQPNQSTISIDIPVWNSTISGPAQVGGWAIDGSSSIAEVDLAIDGIPYGNAVYGLTRTDVCKVYPGRPGCPNVGWGIWMDTSTMADGLHTLTITARTADIIPRVSTASLDFSTDNSAASVVDVDLPVGRGTYSGVQQFAGWALNRETAVGVVSIAIDGVSYGNALYGGTRSDACGAVGNYPGCPNVGWGFAMDTASLTNGQHTLSVTAFTNEEDYVETTSTIPFTTSNANAAVAGKSLIYADDPGPNNIYSGQQTFSGWALDDTSAIKAVNVAIDGVSYGPAQYGANRPDVCRTYPGRAGCPYVGWSFQIDTATLTDGVHTLALTVLTADSPSRPTTATVIFTVSNSQLSWLLPSPPLGNRNFEDKWSVGE